MNLSRPAVSFLGQPSPRFRTSPSQQDNGNTHGHRTAYVGPGGDGHPGHGHWRRGPQLAEHQELLQLGDGRLRHPRPPRGRDDRQGRADPPGPALPPERRRPADVRRPARRLPRRQVRAHPLRTARRPDAALLARLAALLVRRQGGEAGRRQVRRSVIYWGAKPKADFKACLVFFRFTLDVEEIVRLASPHPQRDVLVHPGGEPPPVLSEKDPRPARLRRAPLLGRDQPGVVPRGDVPPARPRPLPAGPGHGDARRARRPTSSTSPGTSRI